ncbi:MAG: AI-2E family transporter [Oscillatoriales cyanobacterium SM2_2_1]|nr:AI-2E family transporter [Oscillatoriales cyanobacterium SM2_2_1]
MSQDKQFRFPGIWLTFPLFVLNLWLGLRLFEFLQPLVSVVLTASILAFLLNFVVQLLINHHVPRQRAVTSVFLLALTIFVAVALTVVPIAIGQLSELIKRLPSWISTGTEQLNSLQVWAVEHNIPVDLSGIGRQLTDRLTGEFQNLASKLLTIALDTAGSVVNLILVLILTYYLLANGDRIWRGVFLWFSPRLGGLLQLRLRQNFQNYYVGQATIATLIGGTLTFVFVLLKVPFGILFGLGIGVMSLIPFGGSLSISVITFLIALDNFWLGLKVLIAWAIIEQVISNVLAPRILGELTGLNPAWILISLLVGLKVAGPVGLVVAVPIAGSIRSITDSLREDDLAPPPESLNEPQPLSVG